MTPKPFIEADAEEEEEEEQEGRKKGEYRFHHVECSRLNTNEYRQLFPSALHRRSEETG